MTFSELARELHPFYCGENSIPMFTKELLLQITDYSDAVLTYKRKGKTIQRTEKTFSSYYHGSKEITPIAKLIAVNDHIKREKFLLFLRRNEFDNIKKESLCKAFGKHITHNKLNGDSIFDVITDEYVRIIISSAGNSNTLREQPTFDINDIEEVTISEAIREVGISNVDTFMVELKEIIRNLEEAGHKIASRISNMKAIKSSERALTYELDSTIKRELSKRTNLYPKLESEYEKLQELYDSIYQYNTEHNNKLLAEALNLIAKMNIYSFIETREKAAILSSDNQFIFDLNQLIQNYFEGEYM